MMLRFRPNRRQRFLKRVTVLITVQITDSTAIAAPF